MKILEHPKFSRDELADRWWRARMSALMGICGERPLSPAEEKSVQEMSLLRAVPGPSRDLVLRAVFDKSRKLGLSAVKFLGVTFEIGDVAEVLPNMGVPCFAGSWRSHHSARVLERKGCTSLEPLGAFGCDYWREALDGLVVGLGENERLARHQSCGHGDPECLDVLFTEDFSVPRVVVGEGARPSPQSKFGQIPQAMMKGLEPIVERFNEMKIHLLLDGLSEGVLFYRLEADEGVLCGAGGRFLHESLAREVLKRFPRLTLRDVAPLAVYGGAT